MSEPKYVSPSRIGRFFYLECDRYLRYSSTARVDQPAEAVPGVPRETRPVQQAVLETGYLWEEQALNEILRERALIAAAEPGNPQSRIRERAHSVEATSALLRSVEAGQAIYQPTLRVPPTFYERFGLDPALIQVRDNRPDLIEAVTDVDVLRLRVTDLKASHGLKLSHRIQAALYTLILRDVLLDLGTTDRGLDLDPAIWLVGSPAPEPFDIRAILPPLERFLEHDLARTLLAPAADAAWHVQPRCETCPYFEHCREEMRSTDDLSRLAHLSGYAKRRLHVLRPPVRSVADLATLLADPARRTELSDIGSLRGRADRLDAQIRALELGEPVPIGGNSLEMPRGENVRIVFSVQTEPVSGHVYTWAVSAQGLKGLIDPNPFTVADVASSSEAAEIARVERALVLALYRVLEAVHDYNERQGEEWKAKKSLQAYTFDTYEVALLTGVLTRALATPDIAQQALSVFFHFHRPELMEASDHATTEAAIPVVVLTSTIRRLLALPIEVTYRFTDVVRLLPRDDRAFEHHDFGYFDYELSNQLRPDAIFGLWHRAEEQRAEQILQVMRARVWAAGSLVDGLRQALDRLAPGTLFAWPPKFRLPGTLGFRDPILSRLAFMVQYEALLSYLAIRLARMAPLTERLRSQTTIELLADGGDRFTIIRGGDEVDIEEEAFPDRLLSPATDEGERAALLFADYLYRNKPYGPAKLPLAVTGVREVERDEQDHATAVRLNFRGSSAMGPIIPGQTYRLDTRATDYLSDRAIEEMRAIDREPGSPFVRLLSDPVSASKTLVVPPPIRETALELAESHGMTRSQLGAFRTVVERGVALAWGPPGTGKTHFLALAILCLAEAHRRHGRPYAALVSGFTHAAIDNCLRKLVELQDSLGVVRDRPAVAKLKRFQLDGMDGVELLEPRVAEAWLDDHRVAILGGTVWGIQKGVPAGRTNLVVIDEGSQLKVAESAIAIRRLRPGGRLVVAGDDLQLPPIVKGSYPDAMDDLPPLHRSIFEVLKAGDEHGVLTGTLLENFRMNDTLCRYPAEQLYDPAYTSATAAIAGRRLRLAGTDTVDLPDLIIDPAFPLVVGVIEGVQATAENLPEAAIVADVAVRLRERLCAITGERYDDDRLFWADGLFIVSPHHVQIRAIRRALHERRRWKARPFVDTVDKMQGQECDAVITSYGVADVEYAMNEQEFIYSLNRLNVSTTRGRAKTITLLSRSLLEPPIAAFEDDRVAAGIAYMQGLVRFAERHGETTSVGLQGEARLVLYRVAADRGATTL